MAQLGNEFGLPDDLCEVIRGRRCFAYIGSGLSAGSYPAWHELVQELCTSCGSSHCITSASTPDDLLDAAQDAKDRNPQEYMTVLGRCFGRCAQHANLLYDALLALPFDCYLTVNFDPLLSLKARTAKLSCPQVYAYPALDRRHASGRTIHYLHGLIEEGECPARGPVVLARKEFEDAYMDNSNLMNFLVPTLENEHVVFVGCRLREPAMERIFGICKEHQSQRLKVASERGAHSSPPPRRYIVVPEPQEPNASGTHDTARSRDEQQKLETYYGGFDIRPVWYKADGDDHTMLRTAFETLAALPSLRPRYTWGDDGAR